MGKMKQTSEITTWLKKIFSIQRLSIVVAVLTAYWTYQMYMSSKSSSLSCCFWDAQEDGEYAWTDANGITNYYSLLISDIPFFVVNDNSAQDLSLPLFENKYDKSITHLKYKVTIWYGQYKNLKDHFKIASEMKIISQDDAWLKLEYEKDYLPPGEVLPPPFVSLETWWADEKMEDELSTPYDGLIKIDTHIAYEGKSEPDEYRYTLRYYIIDEENEQFRREAFDRFLKEDVYTRWVGNRPINHGKWAIIMNNHLFKDIKQMSEEEALSFKYNNISDFQN